MSNTRKAAPRLTFAQVQAKISRPRRIVDMVMDAAAAAEIEHLKDLLDRVAEQDRVSGAPPLAPAVARQLQDAERRAETSRVQLVLEAIPHTTYRDLIIKYPATAEQQAEAAAGRQAWAFDPDAFAPVLVHAQLLEPRPDSEEEFTAFWESISDGQLSQLWSAALAVQLQITKLTPSSQAAADILRAAADS